MQYENEQICAQAMRNYVKELIDGIDTIGTMKFGKTVADSAKSAKCFAYHEMHRFVEYAIAHNELYDAIVDHTMRKIDAISRAVRKTEDAKERSMLQAELEARHELMRIVNSKFDEMERREYAARI